METITSINKKLYNINPCLLLTVQEKFDPSISIDENENYFVLNRVENGTVIPICDYIQIGENNEYLLSTLLLKHRLSVKEATELIQTLNMVEGA